MTHIVTPCVLNFIAYFFMQLFYINNGSILIWLQLTSIITLLAYLCLYQRLLVALSNFILHALPITRQIFVPQHQPCNEWKVYYFKGDDIVVCKSNSMQQCILVQNKVLLRTSSNVAIPCGQDTTSDITFGLLNIYLLKEAFLINLSHTFSNYYKIISDYLSNIIVNYFWWMCKGSV